MSEIIRLNNLKRKLEYVREKHKNDKVDTFETNISLMCNDIINSLDDIEIEIRANAIDKFAEEIKNLIYKWFEKGVINTSQIDKIAEQLKKQNNIIEVLKPKCSNDMPKEALFHTIAHEYKHYLQDAEEYADSIFNCDTVVNNSK